MATDSAKRLSVRLGLSISFVVLLVVGASAAVIAFASTEGGSPHERSVLAATEANETASSAEVPELPNLACGSELPLQPAIPAGFGPSTNGPGADSLPAPSAGQFVQHWTSPTSTIELRWPSDEDKRPFGQTQGPAGTTMSGTSADGGALVVRLLHLTDVAPAECATLQLNVSDDDPERLALLVETLSVKPFVGALVIGEEDREVAPSVVPCGEAAPGSDGFVGGDVDSVATYDTSRQALSSFLDDHLTLMQFGYLELRLPDESIAYATTGPAQQDFVTMIRIVHSPGGWRVAEWRASSC